MAAAAAVALEPIVPFGAARILDALHVPEEERRRGLDWLLALEPAPGRPFEAIEPLYRRFELPTGSPRASVAEVGVSGDE